MPPSIDLAVVLAEVKQRLALLEQNDLKNVGTQDEINRLLIQHEEKQIAVEKELKSEAEKLRAEQKTEVEKLRLEQRTDNEKLRLESEKVRVELKNDAEKERLEKKNDTEKERLEKKNDDKAANDALKAWMKEQNTVIKEKFQEFQGLAPRFAGDKFKAQWHDVDNWNVSNTIDDLASMNEDHWSKVIKMNKLLYGFVVEDDGSRLVKARSPAFVIKPNRSEAFETVKLLATTSGNAALAATGSAAAAKPGQVVLQPGQTVPDVPEFEICDGSSISITTIENSLQKSLAESGFSETAISAAVGYGTFSVSAGICAGLKVRDQASSTDVTQSEHKEYHASYNFPRVRLFLDELSVDLSTECKAALEKITKESATQDLKKFSMRFGHVFATQIKLGGCLKSTKFADATFGSSDTERKEAMRVAMGAQFATPTVSVNASGSNENQKVVTTTSENRFSSSSLTWTACGGDALMCANPPLWAASVASHKNWRVIEQDGVLPFHELLDKFEGHGETTKLFKQIAGPNRPVDVNLNPPPKPNPNKKWTGNISFSVFDYILVSGNVEGEAKDSSTDPIYVPDDKNELYLVYKRQKKPAEATFRIFNGDPNEDYFGQGLEKKLCFDNPLLLRHGTDDIELRGTRCKAAWVNEDTFKPMAQKEGDFWHAKFSLCRTSKKNEGHDIWTPNKEQLRNGDLCHLYCHSYVGQYESLRNPPSTGSRLFVNPKNGSLKFAKDASAENRMTVEGYEVAPVVIEFI